MQNIKKYLLLLNRKEIGKAKLLFLVITINAILEMIGVASILPFISIIVNPNLIESNSLLNTTFKLANEFGVKEYDQFVIFYL